MNSHDGSRLKLPINSGDWVVYYDFKCEKQDL